MRARDLQIVLPTVDESTTVARATRVIADTGRVGVLLASSDGTPESVISALDVLRLALPEYLIEDSSLARVLDETSVSELLGRLADRTIGDLIADDRVAVRQLGWVGPDATVIEVAGLLVADDSMIVAVHGEAGQPVGVVTLPVLMDAMLGFARDRGSDLA